MQYRREIDGLRAIAVVPVILFHAQFSIFSGGYVGVDVFFVISGYLITSILISELEQGNFSIVRFYERRARRILPALFAVMFACLPFAYMWMLPAQLRDFAQSLVAVVFFASNILFWRQDGYFAAAAELQPLLHTWSLAVEEQYYLLFPIFLSWVWRFGRNRVLWSVIAVAAVSLLLAEWAWRNMPSANFYLVPTRAWELLAGSICAFMAVGKPQRSSNLLSAVGLGLIVFAMFAYDEGTPFPSVYALVPVLGTALIILFAAQGTWVARLLSLRAFVGIGLISYSAYLWHQPLFAFARLRSLTEPSQTLMAALVVASLLLAWATWYWVEQAFRKRGNPLLMTRRGIFYGCGVSSISILLLSVILLKTPGYIESSHPEKFSYASIPKHSGFTDCIGFEKIQTGDAICRKYGSGKRIAVVWGDSHADALASAVHSVDNWSIFLISHAGCPPVSGVWRRDSVGNAENCEAENTTGDYLNYIMQLEPEAVFLTARWTMYMRGWQRLGRLQSPTHFVADAFTGREDTADSSAKALLNNLDRTIEFLSQKSRVFVVSQVPDLNQWGERDRILRSSVPFEQIKLWHTQETSMFKNLLSGKSLDIIWGLELFCKTAVCATRDAGLPLYSDDNHLSYLGSTRVFGEIVKALTDIDNYKKVEEI